MQNNIKLQSVDQVSHSIQEMDLSRAFQRLSSRFKINAQESSSQEHKAQKVSLRDAFNRLANLSTLAEKDDLERTKVAAELRDHARQLKEAMENVQHDSQKVFLAQDGLDKVLKTLNEVNDKLHQVTQDTVGNNNQDMNSEIDQLFDQLKTLPDLARFNDQQLFGEGSNFVVSVGIDSSVTSNLGLSNILAETKDLDISKLQSNEDYQQVQQIVMDSIEHVEGKIARLSAIHQRLNSFASNISTADDKLKAFGHQLRHISEAKTMTKDVGIEIRKNKGLNFLR